MHQNVSFHFNICNLKMSIIFFFRKKNNESEILSKNLVKVDNSWDHTESYLIIWLILVFTPKHPWFREYTLFWTLVDLINTSTVKIFQNANMTLFIKHVKVLVNMKNLNIRIQFVQGNCEDVGWGLSCMSFPYLFLSKKFHIKTKVFWYQ